MPRTFLPLYAQLNGHQLDFVAGMYLKIRREMPEASQESILDNLDTLFHSRYTARGLRVDFIGKRVSSRKLTAFMEQHPYASTARLIRKVPEICLSSLLIAKL
jgi:hypothetical protein